MSQDSALKSRRENLLKLSDIIAAAANKGESEVIPQTEAVEAETIAPQTELPPPEQMRPRPVQSAQITGHADAGDATPTIEPQPAALTEPQENNPQTTRPRLVKAAQITDQNNDVKPPLESLPPVENEKDMSSVEPPINQRSLSLAQITGDVPDTPESISRREQDALQRPGVVEGAPPTTVAPETVERERYASEGGRASSDAEIDDLHLKQLQNNPNPKDRNGRLKSGLTMGLRAMSDWMARGGDWQGGLAALATGGAAGAVKSNQDEIEFQGQQVAQIKKRQAEREQQRKSDIEAQAKITNTNKTVAETANILGEPAREDAKAKAAAKAKEQATLMAQLRLAKRYKKGENPEFDKRLENAEIMQPDFEPDKKLHPTFYNDKGQLMTRNDEGKVIPVLDETGNPQINPARANKNIIIDGEEFTLPNGQAAQVKVTAANAQYSTDKENSREEAEHKAKYVEFENKRNNLLANAKTASSKAEQLRTAFQQRGGKYEEINAAIINNQQIFERTGDEQVKKTIADQQKQLLSITSEMKNLEKQITDADAESNRYKQQADALQPPPKPSKLPAYNKVGTVAPPPKATESELLATAKRLGLNKEQTDRMLADFRSKNK